MLRKCWLAFKIVSLGYFELHSLSLLLARNETSENLQTKQKMARMISVIVSCVEQDSTAKYIFTMGALQVCFQNKTCPSEILFKGF